MQTMIMRLNWCIFLTYILTPLRKFCLPNILKLSCTCNCSTLSYICSFNCLVLHFIQEEALKLLSKTVSEHLDTEIFDRISDWVKDATPGMFDEVRRQSTKAQTIALYIRYGRKTGNFYLFEKIICSLPIYVYLTDSFLT